MKALRQAVLEAGEELADVLDRQVRGLLGGEVAAAGHFGPVDVGLISR
jgi:hypothetical protein